MVYLIILFLGLLTFYLFSFAKYNWKDKNKRAAYGVFILALATFFYPTILIFLRR